MFLLVPTVQTFYGRPVQKGILGIFVRVQSLLQKFFEIFRKTLFFAFLNDFKRKNHTISLLCAVIYILYA